MTDIVVGFAGMTHLGLVSAASAASLGFNVVGYDHDRALVGRLERGDLPVSEPGLDALVSSERPRIVFTADAAALSRCDVVYISADVPTDDAAASDLAPIRGLIARVAPRLGERAVLVVLCQVPPGFTRALDVVPHDRLYYQVETLVFGRAVERARKPERFIVGCADPARPLPPAYAAVLEAYRCPVLPMRYESAELAKIAINVCLVASVGAANMLAETSEAIGADWAEIVPALRLDRRIGPHAYLDPGLGIAGGNLERDLATVRALAAQHHTDAGIIDAWLANSSRRKDWCWERLAPVLRARPDARIALLGLAYKPDTHSTKNAASLALLAHLEGRDVRVHDPVVPAEVAAPLRRAAPLDCAADADALVIITPWPAYRALSPAALARAMRGRVLIDPYRVLDGREAAAAGFTYHALGMPALAPG